MASAFKMIKQGDYSQGIGGLAGIAVDGGVAFVTGIGIGELYHRKGNKWYGKHAPKLVAAAGKALALLSMGVLGEGFVTGSLNAAGNTGLAVSGLEVGLRHARSSSGKKAILWPKDKALPAGAEDTALGAAPAGKGMTWNQIEELARSR